MKAIIAYNRRDDTFSIVEHNLEDAEALWEANHLRDEGDKDIFTLPQDGVHAQYPSADSCILCNQRARNIMLEVTSKQD